MTPWTWLFGIASDATKALLDLAAHVSGRASYSMFVHRYSPNLVASKPAAIIAGNHYFLSGTQVVESLS